MQVVDARGLSCPQPVILTRKAMAASANVTTVVDSEASRDNVRRMAEKAGRNVTVEDKDGEFHLHILAQEVEQEAAPPATTTLLSDPLVLVVSDLKMGRGNEELGKILVRGFFHTLGEIEPIPDTIIFFNVGVLLVVDDSPVLEDLKALEKKGVTILVCGTCLDYLELKDRLAVGQVSNMYDIAGAMLSAGKMVTL